MAKRVAIAEASVSTGLTIFALRQGVKSGRFPAIRAGTSANGKLLFDVDELNAILRREAQVAQEVNHDGRV